MGRIVVFIGAIIIVLIVGFTIFTVVDMINSARRRRDIERKVAAEHNRQAQELGYAGVCDCSRDKGNKSKKDGKKDKKNKKDKKKFKDNGDASLRPDAMGTLTAEQWFALVYPQLSVDEATSKSLDNLKESLHMSVTAGVSVMNEAAARMKYNMLLSDSMRRDLDTISKRMTQIRERTNDKSIARILDSYCESIERSVNHYIELVQAPVKSNAIAKSVHDIEDAIASVPEALDAILASTYEQDSLSAIIEADGLKAVVEHNKKVFSGEDGASIKVMDTEDIIAEIASAYVPESKRK